MVPVERRPPHRMLTPVIGIAARDHTVADQDPRRVKGTARPCRNTGDTSTWRAASAPLTRYTQLPASCVLTPAGPDRWDVHNGCTHPHGPRSSPQERFAPAEDMPCTGRYPLSGVTAPVTRRQRVEQVNCTTSTIERRGSCHLFRISELLVREPDVSLKVLPFPTRRA